MKIHHKMKHGESIATEVAECKNCGDEFEYYPSEKDGYYCSSCSRKMVWDTNSFPSGEDNPMYSGGKMVNTCPICDNEFETYDRRRKTCSEECGRIHHSKSISGDNHWRWKGGRIKYGQNWHRERRKCKDKQNSECQICGDENVEVHHKKPVREFDNPQDAHFQDNLICLCPKHHRKAEFAKIELP